MSDPKDFPNFLPGDRQSLDELRRFNELADRVNSPYRFDSGSSNPMGGESGLDSGGSYSVPAPIDPLLPVRIDYAEYLMDDATISTGGTGGSYAVSDTITLAGDRQDVILEVTAVAGSLVSAVTILQLGVFDAVPANPVPQASTTGGGTGATFDLGFVGDDSPTLLYSWTQLTPDEDGAFVDLPGGLTGLTPVNPAVEINRATLAVQSKTWLRYRVVAGDVNTYGTLFHEIDSGTAASGSELFPVRIVYREWVTATAVVDDAGMNYAVDDTITLAADRVNLVVKVTSIDGGGGVTGSEIVTIGVYTIGDNPSNPQAQLSTSGSGTGATFTVNLVAEAGGWSPTVFYSWVEQIEDASGFLVDKAGGRTGTVPTNAAVHINRLFLRVGSKAWLRKVSPEVSVTYDGGAVLGPFYDMESWLLKVSDQGGNSETATTALAIVGDGGNVSTTLTRDAVDPGDVSVTIMMSDSPSFTNINISDSVFLGGSATFNFNNVTILNFPGSSSIAFHGARFPSATSTIIGTGSHKDCTFSVSGGTNFGAAGYDVDGTLINGGKAARIAVSGYYHFTSASLWFASSYLNARMFINTSANGSDIITKGLVRTSAGGTIDEDGIYILECSGDYSCAAGDTITVAVWNMDTLLSVTMDDAMLHFHRIPTS